MWQAGCAGWQEQKIAEGKQSQMLNGKELSYSWPIRYNMLDLTHFWLFKHFRSSQPFWFGGSVPPAVNLLQYILSTLKYSYLVNYTTRIKSLYEGNLTAILKCATNMKRKPFYKPKLLEKNDFCKNSFLNTLLVIKIDDPIRTICFIEWITDIHPTTTLDNTEQHY